MFNKRKQQPDKSTRQEPTATPPAPEDSAPSAAGEPEPSRSAPAAASPAAPAAPASRPTPRPDASAVLNRQPSPPVRPDQHRRGGHARQPEAAGQPASDKQLTVGREIELVGEIRACDRLVVEGTVEADLRNSKALEVTATGSFKGSAVIDVAEIAGHFDGELTVRERLHVRATGQLHGTIRYRGLEIESGGRIAGTLVELSDEDLRSLDAKPADQAQTTARSEAPRAASSAGPSRRDPAASASKD